MILSTRIMAQKESAVEWGTKTIIWGGKNEKGITNGVAGPITGFHDGVLFLGGGANFPEGMPWDGGHKRYYSYLSVYSLDGLELKGNFPLPYPTAYGANCSTPQGLIYAGGENENGLSNKVLLVQWNDVLKKPIIKNLTDIPYAITNASIAFHNNMVYLVGGEAERGASSNFLCLDLSDLNGQWRQLPALPISVSHAVTVIQPNGEGNLFLIGGRSKNNGVASSIYSSLYQYNMINRRWIKKKNMPYGLSAGTGAISSGNKIMMFGGDTGETFNKVEELIAAIQIEKDEKKKQELIYKKNQVQSNHPGFNREILLYDIALDSWTSHGTIPFEVPVTTTAIKLTDEVIMPSGEIKAGVRSTSWLIGKLRLK